MKKLLIVAACLLLASCKPPAVRFHAGEVVHSKLTGEPMMVITDCLEFNPENCYVRTKDYKVHIFSLNEITR